MLNSEKDVCIIMLLFFVVNLRLRSLDMETTVFFEACWLNIDLFTHILTLLGDL